MPCKFTQSKDGKVSMISCSRGKRKCSCGNEITAYCEAVKKDGTPCDSPLCEECRVTIGPDTDVCKYHNYDKYKESALKRRKDIGQV